MDESNKPLWSRETDELAHIEEERGGAVSSQDAEPITWQASEFVHHEKSVLWFVLPVLIGAGLCAAAIFILKSWSFAILAVVLVVGIVVIGSRHPKSINYRLSPLGLAIEDKLFRLQDFRSFGVVQEGPFYSVRLTPNKRFMPMVSIYFPEEYGEGIVDILSAYLPMEQMEKSFTEMLAERLRF